MMVAKFRKKPVIVEAMQFDAARPGPVLNWLGSTMCSLDDRGLLIQTLEGSHEAKDGDWIIKGVAGEFYPCKPNIFEMTYEPVEEG